MSFRMALAAVTKCSRLRDFTGIYCLVVLEATVQDEVLAALVPGENPLPDLQTFLTFLTSRPPEDLQPSLSSHGPSTTGPHRGRETVLYFLKGHRPVRLGPYPYKLISP